MDLDLVARPFLIQYVLQLLRKLCPIFLAALGRQYSVEQLPHVSAQLILLGWVQIFLRRCSRPFQEVAPDRVRNPPSGKGHARFELASGQRGASASRAETAFRLRARGPRRSMAFGFLRRQGAGAQGQFPAVLVRRGW